MKTSLVRSTWALVALTALSGTANAGLARIVPMCPDEVRQHVVNFLNDPENGHSDFWIAASPDMACGPAIERPPGLKPGTRLSCDLSNTIETGRVTLTCQFKGTEKPPVEFKFKKKGGKWEAVYGKHLRPPSKIL